MLKRPIEGCVANVGALETGTEAPSLLKVHHVSSLEGRGISCVNVIAI